MAKTFEQFHFSLLERDQPDLLERRRTREDWIRYRFEKRFDFYHHGKWFWWVPQPVSEAYIVGVIEREKFQRERTPPADGAREIEGSFWTGATVIIDPTDRPGGQAVAVENNTQVGQPNALLSSLVHGINSFPGNQYSLLFKALFKGGSFWKFADKHGGQLEFVRFRFTVPNMIFGAGGGVKQGLRRIGNDTDAQEIEVKIESDNGIKTSSEAIREGVAYGEEGNATVTAKALDGERWSSTKQRLTTTIEKIIDFSESKAEEIHEWLKQALDRDQDSSDHRPERSRDPD